MYASSVLLQAPLVRNDKSSSVMALLLMKAGKKCTIQALVLSRKTSMPSSPPSGYCSRYSAQYGLSGMSPARKTGIESKTSCAVALRMQAPASGVAPSLLKFDINSMR